MISQTLLRSPTSNSYFIFNVESKVLGQFMLSKLDKFGCYKKHDFYDKELITNLIASLCLIWWPVQLSRCVSRNAMTFDGEGWLVTKLRGWFHWLPLISNINYIYSRCLKLTFDSPIYPSVCLFVFTLLPIPIIIWTARILPSHWNFKGSQLEPCWLINRIIHSLVHSKFYIISCFLK